jgi:hypothetical protein
MKRPSRHIRSSKRQFVLNLPRLGSRMVLESDASKAELGEQLLSENDDKMFGPLGFWSIKVTRAE